VKVNPVSMPVMSGSKLVKVDNEVRSASFASYLGDALNEVNNLQLKADELTSKMVIGEVEDIHMVMLASEQAKMALQLTVQIRNKLVEAYQEISRMQF
jgi:flagellar hook-basal body complex protein FliE